MNKLKALTTNLVLAVPQVYAQDAGTINLDQPGTDFQPLTDLTFPGVISGLVRLAMVVVALVFFAMLIWGGIRWITSRGDKTEVENARNQVTHALIGLAIVFVAWAIIKLIQTMFGGLDLLNLQIPTFTSSGGN